MGTSGRLDQINFGSIMWSPAINITVLRAAFFLPNCAGHLGTNSLAILVTHPLFYLIYVPLHQVMVKLFVTVSAAFIQLILLAQVSTGLPISPTTGAPESQALSKRNEEHQLFKRHMSGGTITTGEIVGCALVGGIILTAGVLGACNRWHDKIPFAHLSKATKPRIPDVYSIVFPMI
ncbi:hypothetical protein F5887DRAFT_36777 [Amanita rubescens]|nr:hypothetical protein F5887DRAFT_36777 [Amanita rubescens]